VVGRVGDKFFEKALRASALQHSDLDSTALGKQGHLAVPTSRLSPHSARSKCCASPTRLATSRLTPRKELGWRLGSDAIVHRLSEQKIAALPPRSPSDIYRRISDDDVSEDRPMIQWYPGHIGKAERRMNEVLGAIDVVVELRDARAPYSTTHPLLPQWVGSKGHVLVLNRMDQIPQAAAEVWKEALDAEGANPVLIDAKKGDGVAELRRRIKMVSKGINKRRRARGLANRPVRAAVLGYPNVGKSALINRLVRRATAKSENRPGVTRIFSWIQVDPSLLLMDAPGIIPAKQVTQLAAYHLAMCDDISNAAYEPIIVAAALFETMMEVNTRKPSFARLKLLTERYGIQPEEFTSGDYFIQELADKRFLGVLERASLAFLRDFRMGRLGPMCIEIPE